MTAIALPFPETGRRTLYLGKVTGFALIIACLFLSIEFRKRELGDTSLDVQNGLKLIFWIGLCLVSFHIRDRWLASLSSFEGACLLVIAGLALLSASWSAVPLYSLASALGFIAYLGLSGLSVVAFDMIDFYVLIRRCLFVFIAAGLVGGLAAPEVTWQPPSVEETIYRLQGFAANSNNFGRLAALLIVISIGCALTSAASRVEAALCAGFGLAALILSGCRTGLIAAIGTVALCALRHSLIARRIGYFGSWFGFGAIIAFAYGLSLTPMVQSFSRTGLESEIFSLTGRTDLWAKALEMIAARPFFGWGFNGTEEYLSHAMDEDFYGAAVNVHNLFLHLTLGLGIIGLLPACAIFLRRIVKFFMAPDILRDLVIGFIFLNGIAEVDLFATPVITNILFFRIILADTFSAARTA